MQQIQIRRIPIDRKLRRRVYSATSELMHILGCKINKIGTLAAEFTERVTILCLDPKTNKMQRIKSTDPRFVHRVGEGSQFTERSDHALGYIVFLASRKELNLVIEDFFLDDSGKTNWPEELVSDLQKTTPIDYFPPALSGDFEIFDKPNSRNHKSILTIFNDYGKKVHINYKSSQIKKFASFYPRSNAAGTFDVRVTYEIDVLDDVISVVWTGKGFPFAGYYVLFLGGPSGSLCIHIWQGQENGSGENLIWGFEVENGDRIDLDFRPIAKSVKG